MIARIYDSKAYPMFIYTFRRYSDLTDLASALSADEADALRQVEAYLRTTNLAVTSLQVSDDPQSVYYFEKRRANSIASRQWLDERPAR